MALYFVYCTVTNKYDVGDCGFENTHYLPYSIDPLITPGADMLALLQCHPVSTLLSKIFTPLLTNSVHYLITRQVHQHGN